MVVCLLTSIGVFAAWQLPVYNYPFTAYNGGTQNWQICQQKNGWMYFANNYGLLEFDGNEWSLYGIWNSTVIRSVEIAPDGSIYVGGSNEFGRFTSNTFGSLSYEPLSLDVPIILFICNPEIISLKKILIPALTKLLNLNPGFIAVQRLEMDCLWQQLLASF